MVIFRRLKYFFYQLQPVFSWCLFIHREKKKSWFETRIYEWDPCFQFPSRMIGTTVLAFICLYLVSRSEKTLFYFINEMRLG